MTRDRTGSKAGFDAAFEEAYARGRFRRGLALAGATGAAILVSVVLYLSLEPPQYVARWDNSPVTVGADDRTIRVVVTGRACDDHVVFQIQQRDDLVRLTAMVSQHRIRPCGDEPVRRPFMVRLGRPLDGRPLLDGRCTSDEAEASAQEDCPAQPVFPAAP